LIFWSLLNAPIPDPPSATVAAGLAHWRKRLAQVALPVLSTPQALREALQPDASVDQVLGVIAPDLPLGLAVILEASRTMKKARGEVRSLRHAIGMLGLDRVQGLLRSRLNLRLDAEKPGHLAMAEAVASSRLAGLLAYYQARAARREDADFQMWVAQLMGLAAWKLPLSDPQLAHTLTMRTQAGERKVRVERELLGCTLAELNRALLMDLCLTEDSDMMQHAEIEPRMLARAAKCAWTGGSAPEVPKTVGRWLFLPDVTLGLMHMLAQEAMKDWFSKRTDTLLRACSALQHLRLDDTVLFSRQVAWHASHEPCLSGWVVPPLARLFWVPEPRRPRRLKAQAVPSVGLAAQKSHAQQPTVQPNPAAAPAPLPTPTASLQAQSPAWNQVQRFVADCEAHAFQDMASFTKAFIDALAQGLQLKRCALFLKTAQTPQLGCVLAAGFDEAVGPRKVSIDTQDDNLLARLFAHPSGFLWVDERKLATARHQIPEAMRQQVLSGGLILATVHVLDRAVGVLWIDAGVHGATIVDSQYLGVKRLNRHFGEEFTRLMHLQRTQHRARAS
jgi:hypothetical protein